MANLNLHFEKVLPAIKNIFIPAFIAGFAILCFYIHGPITKVSMLTLHTSFYVLSFTSNMILLYFNYRKPIFFIFCLVLSYMLINLIKAKYGANYLDSAAYNNLCFFIPINLGLFFFWPNRRLLKRENIYLLLAIFVQYAIAEQLSRYDLKLSFNHNANMTSGLSDTNLCIFGILLVATFIKSSISGRIMDYSLFFASLCISVGVYHSDSATALSSFYASASLCIIIAIIQTLYNETYRDTLTGLSSRNAYMIHSKDFPLKYSIAIISIDDYEKFGNTMGRRSQNILTKLVATKIAELEKDEAIYRYNDDEFVLLFKNEDKEESFEKVEVIRRAVAAASFLFNPKRPPLKLTVSAAVSEKKRSDANSVEVLVRARKVLQKTRSFSHNVTSKA